jgi:hypothetical protein
MDTPYKIEPGVTDYPGFQLLKAKDIKPPEPPPEPPPVGGYPLKDKTRTYP